MELTNLNIPESKIKQLRKAGIEKVEDLLVYFPKKYIDRTKLTGLCENEESIFLFDCENVHYGNYNPCIIRATGKEHLTGTPVHVIWFNQHFIHGQVLETQNKTVLVAGNAKWTPASYGHPDRYEVQSPAVYDSAAEAGLKIYPVYKKVPGMAAEYLQTQLSAAGSLLGPPPEILPESILDANNKISHVKMISALHEPGSLQELDEALERRRWDDLIYFALRIELNNRGAAKGSVYGLTMLREMHEVQDSLPFELTEDQNSVLMDAISLIRTGKRLNALLQGDVGCGKTIVAQLLMIAFAGNGYQAAMMAPTQILAKQHYDAICRLVKPLGIEVAYIGGGKLRKAEQKALEENLESGKIRLIVGTQALLSPNYKFKNLALVVEDEEHKYGVMQRAALAEKAAGGTHTLTMSATPIPRSLAQTIYGDSLQLYSIHTKPSGRKPVTTGIVRSMDNVYRFLIRNCAKDHRQAYIVCPMIAPNEKVEGVASAEETFEQYKSVLEPYGIQVGLVTGRTPKEEASTIINDFKDNNISVLVATSIIEVGVDVPNANCIVIHNAERFGLAQLHQLRGRVGRGGGDAYCSLVSPEIDNQRLQALVAHSDGFKIAQMDLQLRGAGDFLGVQQSGTEKYLALALQYDDEYRAAQAAVHEILDNSLDCIMLEQAITDHKEQKGGELI